MYLRPRFLAHLIADLLGYFWLSCDICGNYWAGFEWGNDPNQTLYDPKTSNGKGICPKCISEAKRRNVANGFVYERIPMGRWVKIAPGCRAKFERKGEMELWYKIITIFFIVLCSLCFLWGVYEIFVLHKMIGILIVLLNGLAVTLNAINLHNN